MHRSILAARRAHALEKIEKESGIDLSRNALNRAPTTEIFQLFQLEKLAEEIGSAVAPSTPPAQADLDSIIEVLEHTKGVGPKLLELIREELADVIPEA